MKMEIISELTGRYLEIICEEDGGDLGVNVLCYNRLDGILSPLIQQVDEQVQYVYEIGDKLTLTELFANKPFTAEAFKGLIRQLIRLFEQAREYFLEEADMVLLSDYMFYDEKEDQLYVAYLDGYQCDVGKALSKLLEKFIEGMNHRDKELVFLVYGMHKLCKTDPFTLGQLTEFMGETVTRRVPGRSEDRLSPREAVENPTGKRQERRRQEDRGQERRGSEDRLSPRRDMESRMRGLLLAAVAVGAIVFVLALRLGILNRASSPEPDPVKATVLILLLIVVEGYLLGKERAKNLAGCSEREIEDERTESLADGGAGEDSDCNEETVVLDMREEEPLMLNLMPEEWQREELKIRKSPFFVGKESTRSDGVIREAEVSRVHAKFVLEEGRVFLIDQESTNGTYVNGKRLVPWERHIVENGDMIGFSSIYYRAEIYAR